MSYKISFGGWESVFAVPTAVVDKGLKLATETQLKVLLYILRNAQNDISDESVAAVLSVHADDVRDALLYWADKGLLVRMENDISIPEKKTESSATKPSDDVTETMNSESEDKPQRTVSYSSARPLRPEPAYVAKRLRSDKSLVVLMDEAGRILSKVLSNADMATLVMLHDTDGLPVEVLLMLMEYSAKIGKGNIRFIQRTGMKWAEEGINTIELAEAKIRRHSESSDAFKKVSLIFGLHTNGTPTKKQLEFADQWVNNWKFSEDMLRLAYERCVDVKGEFNMSYINGILRRWFDEGLRNPTEVEASDAAKKPAAPKKAESQSRSYDLEFYENYSIFDD